MPTLIVENVPAEVYERLQKRAALQQRTLPEEMLHLLERALQEDKAPLPRVPDFVPGEEISAPCDLPRSSRPVAVIARQSASQGCDAIAIVAGEGLIPAAEMLNGAAKAAGGSAARAPTSPEA